MADSPIPICSNVGYSCIFPNGKPVREELCAECGIKFGAHNGDHPHGYAPTSCSGFKREGSSMAISDKEKEKERKQKIVKQLRTWQSRWNGKSPDDPAIDSAGYYHLYRAMEQYIPKFIAEIAEEENKDMAGSKKATWWTSLELLIPAGRRGLLVGPPGTGKCFQRGTIVLMHNGSTKKVEDVVVGDLLMGPDSQSREVLNLSHGFGPMYSVIPKKGESYTVNGQHVLCVKRSAEKRRKAKYLEISVNEFRDKAKSWRHHAKGYRTGVDFAHQEVPIDPYFFGLWLGDGNSTAPCITTTDHEVMQSVMSFAASRGLVATEKGAYGINVSSGERTGITGRNSVLTEMQSLGVLSNKHIPLIYKANSREVRLALLAGLMDSDGSFEPKGKGFDFISKSAVLAQDTAYIARSLGMAAYVKPCTKSCQTGASGVYYRVYISGNTAEIPTKVERKKATLRKQIKDVLCTGIRILPVGDNEYFGFEVDGDHKFLLGDFTVTHNSTTAARVLKDKTGHAHRITMTEGTGIEDLIGMYQLKDGETTWCDGPAVKAMKEGTGLIIDEVDKHSAEVGSLFYALLDDEPQVTLPTGEHVVADNGYKVLCTSNANISALPEAIIDRMEFVLLAMAPHPDAMEQLTKPEAAAVQNYYRGVSPNNWQWTGLVTLRRMRSFHKLLEIAKDEVIVAEAVFGQAGKEVLSSLVTSAVAGR